MYGSDSQSGSGTSSSLASYKFEVCDSLMNIGPIKEMSLGMPAFLSVSQLLRVINHQGNQYDIWGVIPRSPYSLLYETLWTAELSQLLV